MGVKFVVDENIGRPLVVALRAIDYDIEHITDTFPCGTADEKVLEYVGSNGYALISKDDWIRRHPNEKASLLKYKVVAFFLGGQAMSMREMHKQVVLAWDKMEQKATQKLKDGMAAAFKVARGGGTVIEIELKVSK